MGGIVDLLLIPVVIDVLAILFLDSHEALSVDPLLQLGIEVP